MEQVWHQLLMVYTGWYNPTSFNTLFHLPAVLDQTHVDLRQSQADAEALQLEVDKIKNGHVTKMEDLQKSEREKLDKLSQDIDAKWREKLK